MTHGNAHIRVALVGDFNSAVVAHQVIPRSLALAGEQEHVAIEQSWIATSDLAIDSAAALDSFNGIWCVPASPYASMEGALNAIRYAREVQRPFLGTCGGYQHALIEIARNVSGLSDADHTETSPNAQLPLIVPLACALVEARGEIHLVDNSRARALYGVTMTVESYHCTFGLNAGFRETLEAVLTFTGFDADGDPRIFELHDHTFFMGTLFQPERSALKHQSHPVIRGFVRAAATAAALGAT